MRCGFAVERGLCVEWCQPAESAVCLCVSLCATRARMLCVLMMSATSELQKWMLDGQGPANACVGTTTGSSQVLVEGCVTMRFQDIFGGVLCQHGTHPRTLCLRAAAVAPLLRGLNAFDGDEDAALPCATTRGCTPARTGVLLLGFMGDSADCAAPMLLGVELSKGGKKITPCMQENRCRRVRGGEMWRWNCMMYDGSDGGQETQRASSQAPLVSRWRVAPRPTQRSPTRKF
jgi:hypothetical protein